MTCARRSCTKHDDAYTERLAINFAFDRKVDGCPRGDVLLARSYCFKTISFLTEVTPATARVTFVAVLMSSLEFTKPLN